MWMKLRILFNRLSNVDQQSLRSTKNERKHSCNNLKLWLLFYIVWHRLLFNRSSSSPSESMVSKGRSSDDVPFSSKEKDRSIWYSQQRFICFIMILVGYQWKGEDNWEKNDLFQLPSEIIADERLHSMNILIESKESFSCQSIIKYTECNTEGLNGWKWITIITCECIITDASKLHHYPFFV